MREYLKACQVVAEKREQEHKKIMDRILTVALVALFWTAFIAVYMIR